MYPMPTTRKSPAGRAPTVNQIVKAMAALEPKENPLQKHASTIVVAVILALILWVGNTVSGMTTTVTRISTNVDQLQTSIGDLRSGQSQATKTMADLQAAQAKNDARADAIEADMMRVKERVRQLEGKPPLTTQ